MEIMWPRMICLARDRAARFRRRARCLSRTIAVKLEAGCSVQRSVLVESVCAQQAHLPDGHDVQYGRILIRVSDDNGATWSDAHYLTEDTGYHTAPTPMAFQNGRIYRAFEFHPEGAVGIVSGSR